MNRFSPPPSGPDDGGEDRLLRRYHEANALDDARPGPALRETVLAHARSVATAQKDGALAKGRAPASNDTSWTLRALGSLAVLGLVGLLMLQFDRGTPEERDAAFGGPPAPAATRPAPAAATDSQPAGGSAAGPTDSREAGAVPSLKTVPASPPVPDATREAPAAATPPPAKVRPTTPQRMAEPAAGPAPAPMAADSAGASMAGAPAAPAAAPSAERAAPDALTQAAPDSSNTEPAAAPAAREPARNPATLRREAPAADRARSAAALPPLLAATAQGDPDAVRRLLAAGTDVNTRDATGRTALMLAAQRGNAALIRLLLDAGAEPALRDKEGLSATDHATQTRQTAVLPLLR